MPGVTIEVEIKLAVPSLDDVRMRLSQCGARRISAGLETNTLYDRTDGALRRMDAAVRIRTFDDDHTERTTTMTYKGPVQQSAMKRRREIELTVSNADAAAAFLEAIDLQPVFAFQKKRERWRHDDCFIDLDQIPELGTFIEIEGPDETAIAAIQKSLALDNFTHLSESYPRLLAQAHPGRTDFRFDQAE